MMPGTLMLPKTLTLKSHSGLPLCQSAQDTNYVIMTLKIDGYNEVSGNVTK